MEENKTELSEGTLEAICKLVTTPNGLTHTYLVIKEIDGEYDLFFPGIIFPDSIGSYVRYKVKWCFDNEDSIVEYILEDCKNNRLHEATIFARDVPRKKEEEKKEEERYQIKPRLRLIKGGA